MAITLGVIAGGSWWATLAIRDGEPSAFLLRFLLVVLLGTYYLVLVRVQTREIHRNRQAASNLAP